MTTLYAFYKKDDHSSYEAGTFKIYEVDTETASGVDVMLADYKLVVCPEGTEVGSYYNENDKTFRTAEAQGKIDESIRKEKERLQKEQKSALKTREWGVSE